MVVERMISSDSHIVEYPTLWQERVPPALKERAPKVVREEDGDWWYVESRGRTNSFAGGVGHGDRLEKDPSKLKNAEFFENVREGALEPVKYLDDNERDGVYGSVIYPTQGLFLWSVPDSTLVTACMRAYNDYLAEFCSQDLNRMKGVALFNLDDVDEGVAELERCANLGLKGAAITVQPPPYAPYDHPMYEPFWAAAADLRMPLSLHVATQRADWKAGTKEGGAPPDVRDVPPWVFTVLEFPVRQSLAQIILSGVFERHPQLRVGAVEFEVGWMIHFIFQLDYTYVDRPARGDWYRYQEDMLPSDYFRRNVFASFQEDRAGLRERHYIGMDALMWGSDYPHIESTFPRSREVTAEIMKGVPDDEQEKILFSNCYDLYEFDLSGVR